MFFSGEKGGKARNKTPENEHFYADVKLTFDDGIWRSTGAAAIPRAGSRRDNDLSLVWKGINELFASAHQAGTKEPRIPRESLKQWLLNTGAYEPGDDKRLSQADKKAVNRAIKSLVDDRKILGDTECLWLP